MKTFQQFKQDINEAVPLAIPAGIALKTGLGSLLGSSALKAVGAGALTGGALTGAYFASKKNNKDKGEEEIQQRKRAEEEEVAKALGKDPGELLPKIRKRDIIKRGIEKYKEGLRAGQEVEKISSTGRISSDPKDFKNKEGIGPAEFVKNLLKKQAREYKRKQIKNKKIDRNLNK